jgi:MoxR-like ATPase
MVTKEDLKAIVESVDEPTLDHCVSSLQDEHGVDRNEARHLVLVNTLQRFEGGETYIKFDDDIDFESFTNSGQGQTVSDNSDSAPAPDPIPDSSGMAETIDWDAGSVVFDGDEVDAESPPETSESYHHVPIREDASHPLVPSDREYLAQEISDGVTDVMEFTFAVQNSDFGVLLTGEPGTGKGHLVKTVAAKANIPLIRINMGTGITKEKLIGRFVPRANGDGLNGQLDRAKNIAADSDLSVGEALESLSIREKFVWKDGWFTKAFKNGWWILIDEINAAPPETMMPFFGALEDSQSRSLELTERSQTIKPHPGFRFIATRNPSHHRGTNGMNDALKDRMFELEKDYLPKRTEANLVQSMTSLNDEQASQLVEIAAAIRAGYPEQLSRTLTPRGMQRIGQWADLYPFATAVRKELLEGLDFEDERDPIERKIEQVLG